MLFNKHFLFASLSIACVVCSTVVMSAIVVGDKFEKDGIVTDLHLPGAPEYKVEVSYATTKVNLGNTLSKNDAKDKPTSLKWPSETGKLYSVIFVDPDAPSRQGHQAREWRHWVVTNVRENKVDNGNTLTEYRGPSPPSGTGFHRYVFLIYEQDGELPRIQLPDNRAGWKVNTFASEYNLRLIAGNYFQTKTE